jgi:predicted membrane protein
VQLRIQVTQYGTVALAITGAAAGVLFATAGYRLVRRAARARRTASTAPAPTP